MLGPFFKVLDQPASDYVAAEKQQNESCMQDPGLWLLVVTATVVGVLITSLVVIFTRRVAKNDCEKNFG